MVAIRGNNRPTELAPADPAQLAPGSTLLAVRMKETGLATRARSDTLDFRDIERRELGCEESAQIEMETSPPILERGAAKSAPDPR